MYGRGARVDLGSSPPLVRTPVLVFFQDPCTPWTEGLEGWRAGGLEGWRGKMQLQNTVGVKLLVLASVV